MRAWCIIVGDSEYSRECGVKCIRTGTQFGLDVRPFWATPVDQVEAEYRRLGIRWTWANGNRSRSSCSVTGLKQHPYRTKDVRMRMGCSLSHYQLWRECVREVRPYLILEHDAVFDRPLPKHEWRGACMVNDPRGAAPNGERWAALICAKGEGIHAKSVMNPDDVPDGLSGGSAYVITPEAAAKAIAEVSRVGMWPNDAILCRQLGFELYEVYPFVTHVEAKRSMAVGY